MLFIYDDSITVPTDISDAIGIDNFGNLLFKKKQIKKYILDEVKKQGINDIIHLGQTDEVATLLDRISKEDNNRKILYYPSNVFPLDMEKFRVFLQKIKYSDEELLVSSAQNPIVLMTSKSFHQYWKNVVLEGGSRNLFLDSNYFRHMPCEDYYIHFTHYGSVHDFLANHYETRYFNEMLSDQFYITKSSPNIEKIRGEHDFYYLLPEKLQIFFIKPFNFEINKGIASYTMERLNIPDFAMQWIHNAINLEQFDQFLKIAFYFVEQRPQKVLPANEYLNTHTASYIQKVAERIATLKKHACYEKFNAYISSGTRYHSIDAIFDKYLTLCNSISNKLKHLAVSHGDFCFSNILYDKRLRMFKLIDPKGATNENALYMEPYYDIAKLSHSILGGYDYINYGLFDLNIDKDLNLVLTLNNADQVKLQQLFMQQLQQNGFDYRLVRIYEASLFLSMLPLHADNLSKMLAFTLRAIQIVEELSCL